MTITRVERGVPAGGQFTAGARAETDVYLAAPAVGLASMSPTDVDLRIEEILGEVDKVDRVITSAMDTIHRRLGHTKNRRGQWTSDTDLRGQAGTFTVARPMAMVQVARALERPGTPEHVKADMRAARATLIEAQGRRDELVAQGQACEDEWRRRGRWSRFFVVTSSAGHIHSTRACSTCRPTTTFASLANLSGQSEADAVAGHGAILCTVCFPSAPTEWTDGTGRRDKDGQPVVAPTHCAGSGTHPEGETRTFGRSVYKLCPECEEWIVWGYSGLRKHKVKNP